LVGTASAGEAGAGRLEVDLQRVLAHRVHDGEVRQAVAVPVARRDAVGREPRADHQRRREGPVAVAEEHEVLVQRIAAGHEIGAPVLVEVGRVDAAQVVATLLTSGAESPRASPSRRCSVPPKKPVRDEGDVGIAVVVEQPGHTPAAPTGAVSRAGRRRLRGALRHAAAHGQRAAALRGGAIAGHHVEPPIVVEVGQRHDLRRGGRVQSLVPRVAVAAERSRHALRGGVDGREVRLAVAVEVANRQVVGTNVPAGGIAGAAETEVSQPGVEREAAEPPTRMSRRPSSSMSARVMPLAPMASAS
jgi:hypothetical protein